jgi:hypothetical protein
MADGPAAADPAAADPALTAPTPRRATTTPPEAMMLE